MNGDRLELPHTPGCLVCGPENPHGLHASFFVDDNGMVTAAFTPRQTDIGFVGLIHGGLLATLVDEAMVWAAIWQTRRSCVAAEMTVRYKSPVSVGRLLSVRATITRAARRLIETTAEVRDGETLCLTTAGKYVPLDDRATEAFFATLVESPSTAPAADRLRGR